MDWWTELDKWVADYLPDLSMVSDEPMCRHTSFRVGGPARRMAFPSSGEQLVLLLSMAGQFGARPLIIGNGTNLLAPDDGLDRLVVNTSVNLNFVESGSSELTVCAGCGAALSRVANFACKRGLSGLEFAHGIPGTAGGGVTMNAGAYGGELRQVVEHVSVLFPEDGIQTLTGEEMDFGYRHSLISNHPEAVVLSVTFRLMPGEPDKIRETMQELMERRKSSQPLELPSAGSTFKRPDGHYAAALIEQCGLKGYSIGGAQVSEKHAGFIVNRGGASCAEIRSLMECVQQIVYKEMGVRLEPEVRIVE